MTTSRAIVFDGTGRPWRFETQSIAALQPDEILVKIEACTLCGSDLHSVDGRRSVPTPTVLGHEIIGRIAGFGAEAQRVDLQGNALELGDRVVWAIVASCGHCFYCERGLPQKCERAFKYGHQVAEPHRPCSGGLAEHCVLVGGTHILRIPESLSTAAACPLSCATSTVAAALRIVGLQPSERALILGAGMLGLTACAMARDMGAAQVVCADVIESRAELAKRFGATEILHGPSMNPSLLAAWDGYGFDVVIECTGTNRATQMGMEALRMGGRIGLVGAVFPGEPMPLILERLVRRQLSVYGIHNYAPTDLVAAVNFMQHAEKRYPFAELVGQSFSLDEIELAIVAARDPNHIRIAVHP